MLNLLLKRNSQHSCTPGKLFNKDTGDFLMHTLEDKVRDKKIYAETAIPYGYYEGFMRFSPSRNREVPQLDNVPNFSYVQIHSGNSIEDTKGCILVGHKTENDKIWESKEAEKDLVDIIKLADPDGKFSIEIVEIKL